MKCRAYHRNLRVFVLLYYGALVLHSICSFEDLHECAHEGIGLGLF